MKHWTLRGLLPGARPLHGVPPLHGALLLALVLGTGCSQSTPPARVSQAPLRSASAALAVAGAPRAMPVGAAIPARIPGAGAAGALSREYEVDIDVPENALERRYRLLVDRCGADTQHHCTLLESDLSIGDNPSARVRVRIDPPATEALISYAASLGRLEHRSTSVEDLAPVIEDTQTRLAMLTAYRKQLLELSGKAGTHVEAAIKIAAELSNVQTQLERTEAEASNETRRTQTDLVAIELSAEHHAILRPIRAALDGFLGNLSNGIAQAITALAYILPWACLLVPLAALVRLGWRRWRRP